MTPPVIPDPNSQELNQDSTQTLNTETQPLSRSVDTTGSELYFSVLREKEAEIARLRAENSKTHTPRKTGDEAWTELTQDPRKVIQEEVAEAVRPIREFVETMRMGNAFAGLKQQAAGMSAINAKVIEKCGNVVDSALTNAAPNLQNVVAAISLAIGLVAQGQVNGVTMADLMEAPTQTRTQVPATPRTVPPNIAPSSSPLSRPTEAEKSKPWEHFSENELAMARYYKMTPEDFWKKMQGDSIEVDPTKSGGGKK